MKRIFLSLPMSGKTDEQISHAIFHEIIPTVIDNKKIFTNNEDEELLFVDNFCVHPKEMADMEKAAREAKTPNLVYLGEALKKMATCDAVIFAEDYGLARGCLVEEKVAQMYSLETYYISVSSEGERIIFKYKEGK